MVIVKAEISEKSWINSRTVEDDITQHEATSKYPLSIGITDSGDTPNPPPSNATLDGNIIIETAASPDVSFPVTYTPESSVEPKIKRENSCSITRESLLSLP
ncbi:hypothetical protein EYC80_008202 [Monilinia laxa]|uniref:Uncharacterized protein n=1 Tax=Monilinia laxa TaxID=61186 RepID=A0A5N6JVN8_MONLA|nr:hypothetical protein EYC80_008202 [Monilinia laxa]